MQNYWLGLLNALKIHSKIAWFYSCQLVVTWVFALFPCTSLFSLQIRLAQRRLTALHMLIQSLSTTLCSVLILLRMEGKKSRVTQWTFAWILNAVKNIRPMKDIITRIREEMREIPQILAEIDLWKTSINTTRNQSMHNCSVLVSTIMMT